MHAALRLLAALPLLVLLLLLSTPALPPAAAQTVPPWEQEPPQQLSEPPTIDSITPDYGAGAGGTELEIAGSGFSMDAGETRFVGLQSQDLVGSVNCTSVTHCTGVLLPTCDVCSETGPIFALVSGQRSPDFVSFTWYNVPVLESLDPPRGPATGGNPVALAGGTFPSGPPGGCCRGPVTVRFGDAVIELPTGGPRCESIDTCTVTAPPGNGTVRVTVETPGGVSNPREYTYEAPPPTIASITPGYSSHVGGQRVTIVGSGFHPEPGATRFGQGAPESFDDHYFAQVQCQSSTLCTAITTAINPGPGSILTAVIRVLANNQMSASSIPFRWYGRPNLVGLSPSSGPPAGGNRVELIGSFFPPPPGGATTVLFGDQPGTNLTCDPTYDDCTVTAPPGAGRVPVVVRAVGGESEAVDYSYISVTAPTITSITPTSGPEPGGTVVTITGHNLTSAGGPTTVSFGGTPATTVRCSSAATCEATSPPGTGTVSVRVTVEGQSSADTAADDFIYEPREPQEPPPPMTLTVQVWRQLPPLVSENQVDGTVIPVVNGVVEALVEGVVCGQGVTDSQGRTSFTVAADPPTPGCGQSGRALTFRVNGAVAASDPLRFQSGGQTAVTLILPGPMPPPRR